MTNPTSMVEKVARALAPLSWAALGLADTLAHKNRRTASIRHARAAILALRETNKRVLEDGFNAAFVESGDIAYEGPHESIVWRCFIDAILTEDAGK